MGDKIVLTIDLELANFLRVILYKNRNYYVTHTSTFLQKRKKKRENTIVLLKMGNGHKIACPFIKIHAPDHNL